MDLVFLSILNISKSGIMFISASHYIGRAFLLESLGIVSINFDQERVRKNFSDFF